MDHLSSQSQPDEIDYLHPDGKPQAERATPEDLDARPSWRDLRKAMEEADGHYCPKPDPYLDEQIP